MRLAECQDLDAVAEKALRHISDHVNQGTGLGHSNDLEWAVAVFSLMYDKGSYPHPDAVRHYLIAKCGWREDFAAVAGHVWETLASLRDFQTSSAPFPAKESLLDE